MVIDTPEALQTYYRSVRAANGGTWPDFERLILRLYTHLLTPGDWAVDGGACVGLHTFPLARRVGPGGQVHAFEPVARLARWLRLRGPREGPIQVHEFALSHHSGMAEFVEASDLFYSGLRPRRYPQPDTTLQLRQVRTVTLDEIVPASAPVRFIKLVLEGGEFDALRGGERLINAQRPVIVFEYDRTSSPSQYGFQHEDLLEFFSRLDYRLFDMLGVDFDNPALWEASEAWYFTAWPRERPEEPHFSRAAVAGP